MNAAPFFPAPLPGEIHFSILARYHVLGAGALSTRDREAISGSRNPSLLQAANRNTLPFATYIAERTGLPRDQVLALHTVLPYYRPFVDLPGCALESVPQYLASFRRVRSQTRLRYCPDCVDDSIKIHGQPYWRRQHQLPFITVCVIHRQRLLDAHEITQWNTRLPLPPASSVASDIVSVDVAEEQFAKISNLLLTQNFPARGVQALLETWRASWYQHRMHEDGRWKYSEILDFYRSKLGNQLVDRLLIEYGSDSPQEIPWFLDFLERNGQMHHPVIHVLFAMVFFDNVDNFFEQVTQIGNRI
jgi:hypothetical protein